MMPRSVNEETRVDIFRSLVSSFSNLRGRDYAFKKNALADNNVKKSLRAKLAVASTLAEEKKAKKAKEKQANKS